jgi:hypothetical protein
MEHDDFELHRALEEVAPTAVRTLVELLTRPGVDPEMQQAARERLQEIRSSGLLDAIPLALREEVEILIRDQREA